MAGSSQPRHRTALSSVSTHSAVRDLSDIDTVTSSHCGLNEIV